MELKQIQDFSGRFVETANMSSRVADVAQDRSREKNQEKVSFLIQRVAELYYFFLRFAPCACASQKEPDFEVIMARARTRREPKEKLFSFYQGKNAALGGFS